MARFQCFSTQGRFSCGYARLTDHFSEFLPGRLGGVIIFQRTSSALATSVPRVPPIAYTWRGHRPGRRSAGCPRWAHLSHAGSNCKNHRHRRQVHDDTPSAKNPRGFIPTDKRERLVKDMRPGIEQNAAQVALKGLPIPAPPKPPQILRICTSSQHAGLNDLLDFIEERLKPVVLEGANRRLDRCAAAAMRSTSLTAPANGFSLTTCKPACNALDRGRSVQRRGRAFTKRSKPPFRIIVE